MAGSPSHSSNIITEEIMYNVEIPIIVDENWNRYEYRSYARGYHAYMNIWTPLIGESLICRKESDNPIDENAIAIIKTDSVGKETVVGHLPENIAKLCFLFLKVPFTSIKAEVTGKRVNRGGGYGLEMPVIYYFSGPRKLIDWTKEKLKIRMENLEKKTKKCLK